MKYIVPIVLMPGDSSLAAAKRILREIVQPMIDRAYGDGVISATSGTLEYTSAYAARIIAEAVGE